MAGLPHSTDIAPQAVAVADQGIGATRPATPEVPVVAVVARITALQTISDEIPALVTPRQQPHRKATAAGPVLGAALILPVAVVVVLAVLGRRACQAELAALVVPVCLAASLARQLLMVAVAVAVAEMVLLALLVAQAAAVRAGGLVQP